MSRRKGRKGERDRKKGARASGSPNLEALEPRVLLSTFTIAPDGDSIEDAMQSADAGAGAVEFILDDVDAATSSEQAAVEQRTELVFVDTRVDGYQALVDDLRRSDGADRSLEVFLLDPERDGVEQITDILTDHQGVDAIHIVSHGTDGAAQLGDAWLSGDTLSSYEDALSSWTFALTESADVLFYGCDLAAGESGEALVDSIAKLTGADVAASDDLTGAAALGGDWTLEYSAGQIETNLAFSQELQDGWAQVLDVTVDATSTGTAAAAATSQTVSHTTSGGDREMLVSISFGRSRGDTVSSVTYNGTALSLVGFQDADTDRPRIEIWALTAPDTGTHDVIVNLSGNTHEGATIGVTTFNGVDQTTPLGSFSSAEGDSTTPSVTVASATGELVFGAIAIEQNSDYDLHPGTGQTELWDLFVDEANGGGSIEAGATSVDITWDEGTSERWAIAGVSMKSAGPVNDAPINAVPGAQTTPQDTDLVFSSGNGNQVSISDADAGANQVELTLAVDNGTLRLDVPVLTPVGVEVQPNTTTTNPQAWPDTAIAPDGSSVTVWVSTNQDGDSYGIYGQRYDADGNTAGGEFLVNTTTADAQRSPAIAIDDGGNFVVVWESFDQDAAGTRGIFGQRFLADGTKDGAEFQVNSTAAGLQDHAAVAMRGNGEFVVSWVGDGVGGAGGVFFQRYDNSGTAIGTETRINASVASTQDQAAMAMDDNGNFVITWTGTDANFGGVYAQRFDATGTAQGANFQVNTHTSGYQDAPAIASAANGDFVIVWTSAGQDGSGDGVYGQRYASDGTALGGEFRVNSSTSGNQEDPSVAMDGTGFMVAWTADAGGYTDIHAREFDADGNPEGSAFTVNTTPLYYQWYSSVSTNGNGGYNVTWSGGAPSDTSGISMQRYGWPVDLTITAGDSGGMSTMTFRGTIADINTALEGMVYTPDAGFNGVDTLTITTDDLGNTGSGGPLTDVDTVDITVGNPSTPVIDLDADDSSGAGGNDFAATWAKGGGPVTVVDTDATLVDGDENLTLVNIYISNPQDGADEFLSADPGTTGLTVAYSAGTHRLVVSGSATAAQYQDVLRTVTYDNVSTNPSTTPRLITFSPRDSLSIGNTATTTLSMTAGNDAPTALDDSATLDEGASVVLDLAGNDTDSDNALDLGSIVITSTPANGTLVDNGDGTLSYSHDGSETIGDSFSYTIDDVAGATSNVASVTLTINPLNDAPSFFGNPDGIGLDHVGETGGQDGVRGAVLQPDGKALVSGTVYNGTGFDASITRYNVDGTIDTSFGVGGTVVLDATGANDSFNTLTVQDDGRIVAVGSANFDLIVTRFEADGSLDATFGTGGVVILNAMDYGHAVEIQPTGEILVAGYSLSSSDFKVVRLDASGALDPSFGTAGVVTTDTSGAGNVDRAYDMVLQPDGRIVVVGDAYVGGSWDFAVTRYEANGTLDATFGSGGIAIIDFAGFDDYGGQVALQDDGKIIVSGRSSDGSDDRFALVRLDASGALDATFGTGGKVTTDLSAGNDQVRAVEILSDGRILVAGTEDYFGSNSNIAIVRFDADGTPDPSFGTGGQVIHVTARFDQVDGMLIRADGSILVAGEASGDHLVAQFSSSGTLDTSFSPEQTLNGTPTFVEDGAPVVLDADVDVSDAELDARNGGLGNYSGASLTIARDGGASSEDGYAFTETNGLSLAGQQIVKNGQVVASFDIGTVPGQLTIAFTDANGEIPTSTDVDNILRQINYFNSSDTPPASVQLGWTFDDGNTGTQGAGGALEALGSTTVSITAVNDAPVLTNGGTGTIFENGSGLAPFFTTGTVSDPDGGNLAGGILTFSVASGGDGSEGLSLAAFAGVTTSGSDVFVSGVQVGTYTGGGGGTPLVVTFNADATLSRVESVFKALAIHVASEDPTPGLRSLEVVLTDGDGQASNIATASTTFSAVNDPPSVIVAGTPLAYTENDGPAAIDPGLSISDVDNANLIGATVQISSGYAAGEDSLTFIDQLGITGSYDSGTGVLTLSGTASVADYETALRSVTYSNSSELPDTTNRVVSFQVSDGVAVAGSSRTISVASINDDPTNAGGLPTDVVVTEDVLSSVDLSAIDLADVDANNQLITLRLTTSTGGNLYSSNDLDVTVLGSGFGTMTLTGGVADLNSYLNTPGRIQYLHGTSHMAGDNVDTIQVDVYDNGNTGTGGGGVVALGTVSVDITPVNDAPIRTAGSITNLTVLEDSGLTSLGLGGLSYAVGGGSDEAGQSLSVEITVIPDSNLFGKIYLADGTTQVGIGTYTLTELQGMQFEPILNENGGPSFISFRIYDDGGTGNGGSDFVAESMQISITPQNDAPTAVGDSAVVDEGASVVINVIGNDSDPDSALDPSSIVITSGSANGTLIDNGDGTLTYTHDGSETVGDSFSYTIDDASGATSNVANVSITVTPVNDAPVLDNSPILSLDPVSEDAGPPSGAVGTLVSSLVDLAGGSGLDNVTDPDGGAFTGIAITQAATGMGTWYYSTDDGANWSSLTGVSESNALLLTADPASRLYFQPNPDFSGLAVNPLNFRAWDQTAGSNGGFADVTTNGGTSAFSSALEYVSVPVTAVNDAPSITSDGGATTANVIVAENTTAVTTVTTTDVDGGTPIFSITGGADQALFSVDPNTGALTFDAAPDFEAPADADLDNVYEVIVQANDGSGGTDTQAISVTVTDVATNLVVTTTADLDDGDTSSAEALNASKGVDGAISLSEAITAANNSSETVTISFNLTGPLVNGAHTIAIGPGGLPAITDTVIIDGTTNPDYAGTPVIELDGSLAGAGLSGITLGAGSDGSTIQGLVINRFAHSGILLTNSDNNTITGNYIGTDASGDTQSGSDVQGTGITVFESSGNIIGGTGAGEANVLSGNRLRGVLIQGSTATGNQVLGNFIGTNSDGSVALTNVGAGQQIGVYLYDAPGNTIGGTATVAENVVSGNITHAIYAWGPNTSGNQIHGNIVGLDASASTAIGNGSAAGSAIAISSAAGNMIGGTAADEANIIAGNPGAGIALFGSAATDNAILSNVIYDNGSLAIDLSRDEVSDNDTGDADTGPNQLQNFPVLSSALTDGSGNITIEGSLDSTPSTTFRIEFFASTTGDASGHGEAERFLGFVTVTTDATGNGVFSAPLSQTVASGELVTATATVDLGGGSYGDTSELAGNIAANLPPTAVDDTATVNEGGSVLIDLADNDTDPDNALDLSSIVITSGAANGTLVDNGDGTLTYTHDGSETVGDSFSYAIDDVNGATSNVANVSITVTPANDAPAITSDGGADTANLIVAENTTAVTTITTTDMDGGTPTFSITGGADQALFSIDPNTGALTFDAAPDFEAPADADLDNVYEVIVQANDGSGGTDTQAISVTVTDVATNLVVTTTVDLDDGDTSSAEALNASMGVDGAISLSEAITAANNSPETVTISFDISEPLVGGAHTFVIAPGGLPQITDTVIIDGTTDSDYAGTPVIVLDGSAAGAGNGLTLAAGSDGSTIRGLVVNGFSGSGISITGSSGNTVAGNYIGTDATGMTAVANTNAGIRITNSADNIIGGTSAADRNVIAGNDAQGIAMSGITSTGNTIQGNYVGTNAAGTAVFGNIYGGIWIGSDASNNVIGGAAAGAGNVISGHGSGIQLLSSANNNTIQGNLIGTDATGTIALGNNVDGIVISGGAHHNTVGGPTASTRNVISGNGSDGIEITGATTTDNIVQGNYIGTDITGTADLGNNVAGVRLNGVNNTVGGTAAGAGNVIAGNSSGITINSASSTGNLVQGNLIGTNATGTAALGNTFGVWLTNSTGNTFGGTAAGAGNVISGNSSYGIYILGAATTENVVQGNHIGTTTGDLNLGNGGAGMYLAGGTFDNLIGGSTAGASNTIAYNTSDGIWLNSDAGSGNSMLGNTIYSNGGIGIELLNDNVTANDADDADTGPNDLQNYPVIGSAELDGTDLTLSGSLDTDGISTQYRIEFYGNVAGTEDATNGEARVFLGSTTVTTDGSGDAAFGSVVLSGVTLSTGDFVTATATVIDDPGQVGVDDQLAYGSTSEFAANLAITPPNSAPTTTGLLDATVPEDVGFSFIDLKARFADAEDADTALVYTITNNTNPALFDSTPIDGNGVLTLDYAADQNGAADITIRATDTGGLFVESTFTVTVTPVNDAPIITSDGGADTANLIVAENTTAVTTITTTDIDGGTPTFSITGGADQALFSVDPNTGALTFDAAPDFEAPADADLDNVYEVIVQANDGSGGTDTQAISVTVTDVATNLVVTTTADLDDGDTSSAEALNTSKGVDGAISLSEAITAANNSPETVTISFNISEPLVGGAHTFVIAPGGLPQITDTVIIHGTTDSDYSGNPVIRLDGSSAGAGVNGLSFGSSADGSVVRGLMVTGFSGFGIQVDAGADGITIANNWIGTTGTGSTGVGNTSSGVNIQGANTIVGGIGPNDGNVITNNGNEGINVTGSGATGTVIQGNIIGLDPDGSTGSGNTDVGIALLSGAHNTTIGGLTAAARNVISNNYEGIEISSNNNVVQGNYIGTDSTGTADRGNRSDDGVEIKGSASGNLIGGTAAGAGNLIAFNALDGVNLLGGAGNSVLGNQIHSNGGLGIDLGPSGVTANDSGDGDTGANNLQNFPVIDSAELSGSDLTLGGSLDTDGVSTQYRIEFFANAAGTEDATHGEARVYLGSTIVTTDGSGDAAFSNVVLSGVTMNVGDSVTATATVIENTGQVGVDDALAYGATSELAANRAITVTNVAPTAVNDSASVDEGASVLIDLTGNDTDPDNALDLSSIVITSAPANGSLVDNGDGTLTYSHDGSETVGDSFSYTIDDAAGATSNVASVTLTVNPINDAPTAANDTAVVDEGASVLIDLTGNDTDPDNALNLASIVITSAPANGTLLDNGDGTLTYSHDGSETIGDSFSYTIDDAAGATSNVASVTLTVNSVNDAPTAANDTAVVDEGASVLIDLTGNDTDPDNALDLSSIVITSAPANGTLVDNGDGTLTYTHDGSETIGDSFSYTIDDAAGATSNVASVTLTVNPINDAPTAANDTAVVDEGASVLIDLTGNDTDPDNALNLASIVITSAPANGSLVDNGDGTLTYTHDGSETIGDSFSYTIDDAAGATSNVASVTLTVNPINDAPTAANDTAVVDEGASVLIDLTGNDTDPDNALNLASIVITSAPANGSLVDNGDGTLTYTHDGSETIGDSFSYTIDDAAGATSNVASVTLTVNSVNDAPTAANDTAIVDEGASVLIDLTGNDTDPDNALNLASIVITSGPANGTLVDNGDGTLTYSHDGSETVGDSFSYTIDDAAGATSNVASVTLTVNPINDAPTAANDTAIVDEGASVLIDLTGNDTDPDNALNLASIVITSAPANGTLVDNGDGTLTYSHDGSETVGDSFSYTIDDAAGATSNVASVTLTVNSVNDAPTAANDTAIVDEGASVLIDLAGNDTDPDNALNLSSIVITSAPANGTLVDNGDGTLTYSHDGSETVGDSFSYTIDDAAGATSNVASVTLTVNPINDAPTAANDTAIVDEGASVLIDLTGNDTDPDNALNLASIVITSAPANGSLVDNGDGTLTYTHDGSETIGDSFSYTIDDAAGATSNVASVTLTVNPINDAPTAANDTAVVDEGASVLIDLTGNDTDPDNALDLSSIVITSAPANGTLVDNGDGTLTYSHDGSETIGDSFSYTIDDAAGATSNVASVTLTVNPINDAPTAANDTAVVDEGASVLIDLTGNDTDPDNALNLASIVITSGPANGTLVDNGDGTLTYSHDGSETVGDSFSYTIDDAAGATSNVASVTLTVNPINDAPTAANDTAIVDEGASVLIDLTGNDTDPDNALNLASIVITSAPANGTLVDNGDGTLTYTHDGSETVGDSFSYTIDDAAGATSNVASVTLTVNSVNDAPTAANDTAIVDEGASVLIDLAGNDTDPDNALNLSSIVITSAPANGTLVDNGDGTLTYSHDGSETVGDSFSYTIDDAAGATSNVASVTLTVNPINDAPTAANDTAIVDEGASVLIDLTGNDTDPDNALNLASIVITSAPANGSLVDNGDGTLTYTHDGSETIGDSFSYTIDDAAGATSNVASVTLTVNPINDAPTAANDTAVVDEGASVLIDLTGNDTDPDNALDLSSIVITSAPANGTLVDNGDGTLTYSHDGSETIGDSFSYTIDDAAGATSNVASVTLTVNPVNVAPTAANDTAVVDEGASVLIDLTGNDTDPDNALNLASIVITSGPANGTLVDNGDGTLTYSHDGSETVGDSFSYTIDDAAGATSNVASVTLTVNPINDAPTAANDTAVVDEGASVLIDLTGNDTDPDNALNLASIVITSAPANGTLVDNGDGTLTYSHDGSETIGDSFSYTIDDAAGATSNVASVTLTVNSVNDAPTAANDTAVVDEGASVLIDLTGNDTDPDNALDLSSIVITSAPANGTLVDNGDGTLTYSHDGSETVGDSFSYTIDDAAGATSNVASVTLTVNPINDAPTAANDTAIVDEGASVLIDLTGNDTDPDNALNLASIVITSAPANGSLVDNGDGTLTYTHDGSETIGDSFSYTIDDAAGATSNVASVTLTVNPINDAPTAANDTAVVDEGASVLIDLTGNDTDPDNALNLASIVITSAPANGTLVDNGDGTLTYTHDGSETIGDSFSYTIDDAAGATSNVASVTLTVNPINDAPTAANDTAIVDEGASVLIDLTGNDSDPDNPLDLSSIVITSGPANGTLVDNGDGTLTYSHDGSETIGDSFSYTIDDAAGATSNVASVTLTVNPINDAPTAANDTAIVDEGASVLIDLTGNDTDPDNALDLSSIVITSGPANGTLVDNGDGTLTYSHDGSETIGDSFSYTIADAGGAVSNSATVTLTINPQNEAPSISDQSFNVNENTATGTLLGTVTASDVDAGDSLVFSIASGNTGGAFAIDPLSGDLFVANASALDFETNPVIDLNVTVEDTSGVSSAAVVSMRVQDVNEAVSVSGPARISLVEGNTAVFSNANGTAIAISDPDASTNMMRASVSAPGGALNLGSTSGLTFLAGDGIDDTSMTFEGTTSDVQSALDGLSFTPAGAGATSLAVDVTDLAPGGVSSGTAVAIDVSVATSPTAPLPGTLPPPNPDPDPIDPAPEPPPTETPTPVTEASSPDPVSPPPPIQQPTLTTGSVHYGSGHAPDDPSSIDVPELYSGRAHESEAFEQVHERGETGRAELAQSEIVLSGYKYSNLDESLDQMRRDVLDDATEGNDTEQLWLRPALQSVALAAMTGLQLLVMRAGSLLAMALSWVPMWRRADPLMILSLSEEERRDLQESMRQADGGEKDIDAILDGRNEDHDPEGEPGDDPELDR